jgi:hypothetical protein
VSEAHPMTRAEDDKASRSQPILEVRSAKLTHVPELQQTAENQRPKTREWAELALQRYEDGPLYQWWGKQRNSVFWDACDAPFVIEGAPNDR